MMLKRELVSEICARTGEPARVVNAVLRALDDIVLEVVSAGGEMTILSIGKIFVARRKRHSAARIIQTNETVSVPAHNIAKFRPSIPIRRAAKKAKLP
ncbi:Bacterial DNA-binding protein [compost metagenome]